MLSTSWITSTKQRIKNMTNNKKTLKQILKKADKDRRDDIADEKLEFLRMESEQAESDQREKMRQRYARMPF